jgi:cytochrome P450
MPDERIRDEVVSFVQAAYRPTPVALAWAWYLLAGHPEAEAELHRELDGQLDGELRATDVDRLAFARMVMLETLRLYSPVHMTGRVPNRDAEIAGRPVRKGTTALLLNHTMHHDPAFFEDPESFRPRRWEDELASRLPRFAYFPFSGGPRGCIGEDLATTEMIALLAFVGRRFRVRPEREVRPRGGFLLVPDGGMPIRLEARG